MKTLKKNYEFKKTLSKGAVARGTYIDLYYLPNKKEENVIGIAIQKKLGKSVKRNRVKRIIRENYRLIESSIPKGFDLVFVWRKNNPLEKVTFFAVQEDLQEIFQKLQEKR